MANLFSNNDYGGRLYSAAIASDGGIFVASSTPDDRPFWAHIGPSGISSLREVAYRKLFNQIDSEHKTSLSDLSHINLTLGPNGSYFTKTRDGAIWRDLPSGLEKEIEENQKEGVAPQQVALGRKGSYICLWSNDRWSYHLNGNFDGLIARFNRYKESGDVLAFAALDPHETDNWMLVDADGLIHHSLHNMSRENIDKIQELALGYMQRRARKTGLTFTNQFTTTWKGPQTIKVTPDTNYDEAIPKTFPRTMPEFSERLRSEMRSRPVWQTTLLSAGVVGLSSGLVLRLFKLPPAAGAYAGVFTGCYTYGYAQGLHGTQHTSSA